MWYNRIWDQNPLFGHVLSTFGNISYKKLESYFLYNTVIVIYLDISKPIRLGHKREKNWKK